MNKRNEFFLLGKGIFLSCIIYLISLFLLGGVLVNGIFPEDQIPLFIMLLCGISSFSGARYTARRSGFGSLGGGGSSALGFTLVLICVGFCVWNTISWTNLGGKLILSSLVCGLLAALTSKQKRKKRKGASSSRF